MPGHPDGQNYAIWRGPDFFASSATHVDSTHPVNAQGQVTNYASLYVSVSPAFTGGCTVTVNFYTDSTLTVITQSMFWVMPNGVGLNCLIPIVGNFVKVTIATASVAGGNVQAAILPTNTITDAIRYLQTDNHTSGLVTSIPASTTSTFFLPFLGSGPGFWYVQDLAGSGHIQARLAQVDPNGTEVADIDEVATVGTATERQFVASSRPIALLIQNTDTIAHTVNFYVTVDGR